MRDSSCQGPIGVTFHGHSVRSKPKKNHGGVGVRKKRFLVGVGSTAPRVIVGQFSYDTKQWLEEGTISPLAFSQGLERW